MADQTLRILCFGDSLTAGYSQWGLAHFPYAEHLQRPLEKLFPSKKVIIDISGFSGDRVISPPGQYLPRLKAQCAKNQANPYDWILIMGGTNDLGWGAAHEDVYEALKETWTIALNTGAKVLALNVIEAAARSQSLIWRRDELNQLIAKHEEDRWFHFDLAAAVPYFLLDETGRMEIWDDGLHLTEAGYKRMGDAIAARLVELLSGAESSNQNAVP